MSYPNISGAILKKARILIVDDEIANVRFLEIILQEAGYSHVYGTTDSRLALSHFHRVKPDIVLLDLHMPHIDGFGVLQQMRSATEDSSVPILVLTADSATDIRHRALAEGANDFLIKPLSAVEVLLRITNLLKTRLQNVVLEAKVQERTAELTAARDDRQAALTRLSGIVGSVMDGIVSVDKDQRILLFNAAAERMFDIAASDALGTPLKRFLSASSRDTYAACVHAFGESEVPRRSVDDRHVLLALRADGTEFPIEATVSQAVVGGERVYTTVLRDITERMEIERERADAARQQRAFLRDVLFSATNGRLQLCNTEKDLPELLSPTGAPILLSTETLAQVRRAVQAAGEAHGFPRERWGDLMAAASECAMNAIQHGGGTADAVVCVSMDGKHLQVWVRDQGRGIDVNSLPKATLMKGFSGGGGFGHGFFMMLEYVDAVHLLTGPLGTTVVIEQACKPSHPLDRLLGIGAPGAVTGPARPVSTSS